MEYRKSSNIIINETKRILEKSFEEYQHKNLNYYDDVLKFLNLIFNGNETSILKIRFKKITVSEDIFNLYNDIIKKYKVNRDLFDTNKFDIEDFHDFSDIVEIAKIMCNNLLNRLNYNIVINTLPDGKKKFKINIINNGF
jgi:hypothetical protein